MNLLNYRIGFASNSSSMHSTWHVEDPSVIQEEIENMEFGWDNFVCSTVNGIRMYLAAQFINCLNMKIPDIAIAALVKYLYPEIPEDMYYTNGAICAEVDHQSAFTLPHDYDTKDPVYPSFRFLKDIEKYLIKTKCIVIGDNDNIPRDDFDTIVPNNQLMYRDVYLPHITDVSNTRNSVCLKDGKVWKIFDRRSGKKIRFSFEENVKYDKSTTPELVDLIITNNCNFNCPFCYRGCTPNGKHASINDISTILMSLSSKEIPVFEVAIGGGDILNYPELTQLSSQLEKFSQYIVFNTTLNYKDFTEENLEKIQLVFNTFKGIAISVKNINELKQIIQYIIDHQLYQGNNRNSISFQCIPEIMSMDDLIEIIQPQYKHYIRYNLTFLGFKNTGRGASFPAAKIEEGRKNFSKLIDEIINKSGSFIQYGIDTQLISNIPKIKETQADWAYTEHEGKYSCCIDAVSGYILPSSYSEYKDEYKFPRYSRDNGINERILTRFILDTFKKF